jgi:hypothetical protein
MAPAWHLSRGGCNLHGTSHGGGATCMAPNTGIQPARRRPLYWEPRFAPAIRIEWEHMSHRLLCLQHPYSLAERRCRLQVHPSQQAAYVESIRVKIQLPLVSVLHPVHNFFTVQHLRERLEPLGRPIKTSPDNLVCCDCCAPVSVITPS